MNEKAKPRKTQEHFLPADYQGRCQGKLDVDFVNGFPTFGRVKDLPKGEVLHKFEMRLPIPSMEDSPEFDENCKELFNYSGGELVSKALEKLKTDLDELFKSYLFSWIGVNKDGDKFVITDDTMPDDCTTLYDLVENPIDAGPSYDPARHILAQEAVDSWRYTPKAAGKTMTIAAFIQQVVASGRVKAEDLEGIETQAEVFAKLAELGVL